VRDAPSRLTPPGLARELGVSPEKIVGWIKRGELAAANLAATTSGRPRWSIARADVEIFLQRRAACPGMPARRKRKASRDLIEFF